MKKLLLASSILAVLAASVTMNAIAQPPEGDRPDGPPPQRDGGPDGDGPHRPPHPVMDALDKNGDREISEEEIANATVALKTLDKNADGKLTDDEIRPPRPEGGPGRDGRPDGPPDGGPPRDGDRPPRDGERPPRDGERPPRDGGRPPRDGGRPPRDDGPPRDGDRPPRDGERPPGPPTPERFVEDALRFDADKDGKLDKAELMVFASEMIKRRGRPPGPDRDRPQGRPEGDRGPGDRGGERPQRPPVEE